MLKSHDSFRPTTGRRQILVADDELINRELLELVLGEEYAVLCACDGTEALSMLRENSGTLSLVLLDLMMPGMSGLDLLRVKRDEPGIQQIPVIVITADQNAEVECLNLGAVDFLPKPYPQSDVILARIRRIIELFEGRQTILSTERDALTGLYNREYFCRYAEQFDLHNRETAMDAAVMNINHFRMINERFGSGYGDDILRRVADRLRTAARDTGGIVCRRDSDAFLLYCPHREDYPQLLEQISSGITDGESKGRVRLRMGVYENVDKALSVERRFERAKSAADSARGVYARAIGYYDNTLHEQELFHERLIEDFHSAVENREFEVWYQPKFDIRPDAPILASAEALVRWRHPTLGLVSPGVFIPLFEANGLIEVLDHYVWREAARQLRDWKDRFGFSAPVSVNVSRIDMLDPSLDDTFRGLLAEYGIEARDLLLEITESAYTQDSDRIIATVNTLRAQGFQVEMDDFGTGYSSLNMISFLPIDALKLDMSFIRTAFSHRRDTRMLEAIIEIADYLCVPVIAEGVETEEQLIALKAMGCDIVQGYYFSRPLPAAEYESFLVARRDTQEQPPLPRGDEAKRERDTNAVGFGKVARALSSGYESIYFVDLTNDHYVEFNSHGKYEELRIECSGSDFFADTLRNIPRVVFEGDQERVAQAMQKDVLLARLPGAEPFSLFYRLIIDEKPVYYILKAVRAGSYDRNHLVIGVRNVDEEIRSARRIGEGSVFTPDFTGLAKALSRDIESIYYVDIETGAYTGYFSDGPYSLMEMEQNGTDFFSDCQRDIEETVYSDDWEKVAYALSRETLLDVLESRQSFSMDYRLVKDGKPVYYRLKAIPAETGAFRHIIVGVSNVDEQISEDQRLAAERQNLLSFSRISQALAQDYFIIYYIDVETDYFLEYRAEGTFLEYGLEKRGEDFFGISRSNIPLFTVPEDVPGFLRVFTKDNILREVELNGSFSYTYRMLLGSEPTYVMMKATRLDARHLVIATSNIDARVRKEQAQARALQRAAALASKDELTGVKSKRMFVEVEQQFDARIAEGVETPFAVAVFDLNNLKRINDTEGHAAGDAYIRAGSNAICSAFKHSPVYRIGGDEFAAILRGKDFAARATLLRCFQAENAKNVYAGGAVVACGMADYIPGADGRFQDTFERADADMYENKNRLKQIGR